MGWLTEHLPVVCERSGVGHVVSVATPTRYETVDKEWPVIVVLDGAWMFGTTVDAVRVMSMGREVPEAIVVGIRFDSTDMGEYLRQRARWYSPTAHVPPSEIGANGVTLEDTGQALVFLDFVEHQVLPMIDDRYRTSNRRWLVGHSFSALCGLRCLFDRPSLFDRYLLASPSIWWDDRSILAIADRAIADGSAAETASTAVFMSVGDDEWQEPFNMEANGRDLLDRLRRDDVPASLATTLEVLPGLGHNSSIGAAVGAGLRWLHATDRSESTAGHG